MPPRPYMLLVPCYLEGTFKVKGRLDTLKAGLGTGHPTHQGMALRLPAMFLISLGQGYSGAEENHT